MRCGGVYSAACREEVLKGDYKEASTGEMVRHDRGRALSRRPAGLPEGPSSPRAQAPLSRAETQPGRCLGRHLEGADPSRRGGKRERVEGSLDPPTALW